MTLESTRSLVTVNGSLNETLVHTILETTRLVDDSPVLGSLVETLERTVLGLVAVLTSLNETRLHRILGIQSASGTFPTLGDISATFEYLSTVETVSGRDSLDPTGSDSVELFTLLSHKCLSGSVLPALDRLVPSILLTESNSPFRNPARLDSTSRMTLDDLPVLRDVGSTHQLTSSGGYETVTGHSNTA